MTGIRNIRLTTLQLGSFSYFFRAYCCILLHVGAKPARDLRRRVTLLDSGQWEQLLTTAHQQQHRRTHSSAEQEETRKPAKALELVQKGELSHAARELQSRVLAAGNQATLDELRNEELRPPRPSEPLPHAALDPQPQQQLELNKDIFGTVLRQSRRGKSSGLGGNRNEYLRLCLEDDCSFNLLHAVGQILARAEVPQEIVQALAMSKLTAMIKPNGRIRGIAAGDAFRRLVSKALARQSQTIFRELVAPANFGLCDRGGTDSLIHMVQFLLEEDEGKVLLSVDGVGAFDHVSRARFFEELAAHSGLNSLLPFVRQWYARVSRFWWHDEQGTGHWIEQGDGGEQGDAMMPALFCLAMRRALEEIQALLPAGALVFAYLDDVYVVCDHNDTFQCYQVVREILHLRCHIDINMGKLAAWGRGTNEPPPRVVELGGTVWKGSLPENQQGIKVVGTPIGTPQYIQEFGRNVVNDEAQLLQQIPKLTSLQTAWLILYFCAVPKINHLLRTLPPTHAVGPARLHDEAILHVFTQLFGIPSPETWDQQLHNVSYECFLTQARLPHRLAGCGLRDSLRTSPAAYWASWADTLSVLQGRFPAIAGRITATLTGLANGAIHNAPTALVEAEEAGQRCDAAGWADRPGWDSLAAGLRPPQPDPDEVSLGEWAHGWQYFASNALEHSTFTQFLQELALPSRRRNAQAVGKSRVHSCRGRYSSAWLAAYPGTEHLTFGDNELRCAVRARLGLAVCVDGPDAHGHRRLADSMGGRTHARHTAMIAAVRQVLVEAGGQVPDRNVERLLRRTHVPVPPGDNRRLDLIVPGLNVARGRPLFCDITVVTPLTRDGRPRAGTSNSGGSLLHAAERDNNSVYQPVLDSGLGALYSMGFEVFGRWSTQMVDLLPLLAREKSRGYHPRLRRGIALSYANRWSSLIAVCLQKAVAQARLRDEGADLAVTLLEEAPAACDLPVC